MGGAPKSETTSCTRAANERSGTHREHDALSPVPSATVCVSPNLTCCTTASSNPATMYVMRSAPVGYSPPSGLNET